MDIWYGGVLHLGIKALPIRVKIESTVLGSLSSCPALE